jgi:RNA polymerase sigma-70 factor (ECF subfamily)
MSAGVSDAELADLMLAYQAGSDEAWCALERHLRHMLTALFRTWQARSDVEDLTQEALVKVFKTENFDPGRNPECDHPFRAWCSTIAHRLWISWRKKNLERPDKEAAAGQLPESTPSPEDEVVANDERRRVAELMQACLADLGPLQREVVGLEMIDLTNVEIARVLGIKTGTVGSRLFRAHQQLKEALERRGYVCIPLEAALPEGAIVLATFTESRIVRVPPKENQ